MISAYKELYAKLPTQFQLESYEESCLGDYVCDTQEDLKIFLTTARWGVLQE